MKTIFVFLFYCLLLMRSAIPTVDINIAELQYISDHLTEEECRRLVAALHFQCFELPKQINSAERRLPEGTNCLDLLLHWNSTPKEGKGQTHAEITHRLTQIGRDDLAQWLSKTVFYEISKDLKNCLNSSENTVTTQRMPKVTDVHEDEVIEDEAAWWKIDSILSILIVFGLIGLTGGALFLCCFSCIKIIERPKHDYKKLPARGN